MKQKKCPACGTVFGCANTEKDGSCWCENFPAIFPQPDDTADCLCRACLKAAAIKKINEYIASLTPQQAMNNIAKNLPKTARPIESIDYYIEGGYFVFTAWSHLKRGYCCNSGCRHCPYK